MTAESDRAQEWLERMADTWLTDPDARPVYPLGIVIKDAGWRVLIAPGPSLTVLERIKAADEAEFYVILGDGREVTTRRPMASMARASAPSWQRRERECCCGRPDAQ